jgi:hypothetical protein
MLLEGGSVREGAHAPPNVGIILLLAKPISLPEGQKSGGLTQKHLTPEANDHTI